ALAEPGSAREVDLVALLARPAGRRGGGAPRIARALGGSLRLQEADLGGEAAARARALRRGAAERRRVTDEGRRRAAVLGVGARPGLAQARGAAGPAPGARAAAA